VNCEPAKTRWSYSAYVAHHVDLSVGENIVTAEVIISSASKDREHTKSETVLYQTGSGAASPAERAFSLETPGAKILENLKPALVTSLLLFAFVILRRSWLPANKHH
jgi:hypothetical protein